MLLLVGLWGLINNAGIAKVGPIEWQTIEDFKQVADVNLWGLIDVTKVFLPLIKKECGRIINIASIGGESVSFPSPNPLPPPLSVSAPVKDQGPIV